MRHETDVTGKIMDLDFYQQQALKTLHDNAPLLYLAGQLASEASEVFAPVNKHVHHGKPLDLAALKLELGDVLWYIACLASALGMSMSDLATANIEKLRARHGAQYNPSFYVPDVGKGDRQ